MFITEKYRADPTEDQKKELETLFAAARCLYNGALVQRRTYGRKVGTDYRKNSRSFTFESQCKETHYRNKKTGEVGLQHDSELSWLTCLPAKSKELILKDLQNAYERFFEGEAGYPTERTRAKNNSVPFQVFIKNQNKGQMSVVFGRNSVVFPNLGRIKYNKHKKFYGKPKVAIITKENDEYYICLTVEKPDKQRKNPYGAVGVDVGVALPMALSNDTVLEPRKSLKTKDEKIKALKRELARKPNKNSKRRQKTKVKLGKLTTAQKRDRKAYTHPATTELAKSFRHIVIENLNIPKMTKSAKGDAENHGVNVKKKAGQNAAILNVGWGEMGRQLEYKAKKYGATIHKVAPHFTSQECRKCATTDKRNRTTQAEFRCIKCGHKENADVHSSKVILKKAELGDVADPRQTPNEKTSVFTALKGTVSCSTATLGNQIPNDFRALPSDRLRPT